MKRNSSSTISPCSRGFTLIELLTVIAIIGILAAILIPVVGRVRDSARAAQCTSNVRQMMQAIYVYADEHGRFPPPQDGSRHEGPDADLPQQENTWHAYIAPYAGFDRNKRRMFNDGITWRSNSAEQTIYHCPTSWSEGIIGMPGATPARLDPFYHYGMNATLPQRALGGDRRSGAQIDLGDLDSPTRTMAIMETSDWSAVYGREHSGGSGLALIPHGEGMNVGFYDGSVRRLSLDEFLDTEQEDYFWSGGY